MKGTDFTKPSKELVERFDAAIASYPLVERRLMFGMPAAFVNGNMFASLFGERMLLRLPDAPRAELMARDGGGVFEPMPGRPMKEYALVPPSILVDPTELDGWLRRALEYAQALPAKQTKSRARRTRS